MDFSLSTGTVVAGRYVVERELGRGGMATVYRAHDRKHGAPVALKVLHADLASIVGGERFTREIRITAGLQHPHILPVLDSGDSDGLRFYTMPFVAGETLAARLGRERPLPLEAAVRVAAEVADALAYAHARGVVHRDVKPENILLTGDPPSYAGGDAAAPDAAEAADPTTATGAWHALVVDFGIARAIDGIDGEATTTAARRITESGVSLGTVLYMSPEQATGDVVDARTDVYALGCVLHEMLTGEPPFTGASARVILARHLMDSPPSVRTARPTVGAALAQVVVRAMAKAPADRFASGAAFRDALRRAMAEDEGRPVTSPTGTGPTGTGARRAAGGGRAPRTRGRRVALGAAAAFTVAAVALAARRGSGAAALDPNRVTVFPLRTVGTTPRAAGEDVATMLGTALDRAGPLRWVDGWRLLDGAARADPNLLPLARAAALARAQRSRYFVTGRLVPRGDSVEVVVELNDAARDPGDTAAVVDRASARGSAAEPWRGGLRAFNRLLPRLIPGGAPDPGEEWVARDPAAVARFLLGEAAFRRVHLGEALDHYRAAVAADSAFAWAAVRGAQAATWNHRAGEAAALIRVALAHPLPPRDGHFARGYAAYVDGRPDSAAAEFRRALTVDPDMVAAWVQLGETYTHLLPVAGRPDSLADDAFARALALDSSSAPVLLHPVESRLRRGDAAGAAPMLARFLAADPDPMLAAQLRLMDRCVRGGVGSVDWQGTVAAHPLAVLAAAQALAAGGAQLGCADGAYQALRTYETAAMAAADPDVDRRRWQALVGLQGVRVAAGRDSAAAALVDAAVASGEGGVPLILVQAPLAPAFAARGADAARRFTEQWGAGCARCPTAERAWHLGVWTAHRRDAAGLTALARLVAARADSTRLPADAVLARATAAHATLARGDSAAAVAGFAAVLAAPAPGGSELTWAAAAPHPAERLAYARLLLARRRFADAAAVADVFDSPAAQGYVPYLPASLALRAAAAESLGDPARAARYRRRLPPVGGTPVAIASRP